MTNRTPDNYRVTVIRLTDDDPEKIDFNSVIKAFYMAADIRLVTTEEVWADGEIPVFDMTNVSLRHLTRVVFSTMRLFMKYSQEAHPVYVHQIHIVNCSSLINRVMSIIRPFLKTEVAERIQTHLPNSDTLYKFIPKDILPKEYGGSGGAIDDLREFWMEYVESQRWDDFSGMTRFCLKHNNFRDYLMNDENWRLNINWDFSRWSEKKLCNPQFQNSVKKPSNGSSYFSF